MNVRGDFPVLKKNIIYFDNGATTLKPQIVIDAMVDYYSNYGVNAHRGDYKISYEVSHMYEETRQKVKDFINARDEKEIIFTKNSTESINMIVFGYFKHHLKSGDEILLTKSEHSSNILPWFALCKEVGCKVKYIPLNKEYEVTIDNVKQCLTNKTKVISLAHITNVIGDIRPLKDIVALAHKHNILVVVDGAQSVGHIKVDVSELAMDFLVFSAHKMCGPMGVGALYGQFEYLNQLKPITFGGGMNSSFDIDGTVEYRSLPHRLEAGTPNVAAVIGFKKTLEYLETIGMDNIHRHELELRAYALEKMGTLDNVIVYNKKASSGIIAFNLKDVFSQDTAFYLDQYNICIRAGAHCARILKEELKIKNTCRLSFYFYNTKEEIDQLITALKMSKNIFNKIL